VSGTLRPLEVAGSAQSVCDDPARLGETMLRAEIEEGGSSLVAVCLYDRRRTTSATRRGGISPARPPPLPSY